LIANFGGEKMNNGVFVAVLAATVANAFATPALADWRGTAKMISSSAACNGKTATTGTQTNARYIHPLLFGRPDQTRYEFFDKFWAFGFRAAGSLGAVAEPVQWGGIGWFITTPVTARTISQSPATILATTQQVTMRIEINNFDEVIGCKVTFLVTAILK
jgi:hypothetical protein